MIIAYNFSLLTLICLLSELYGIVFALRFVLCLCLDIIENNM
jgi:hypothetical protein